DMNTIGCSSKSLPKSRMRKGTYSLLPPAVQQWLDLMPEFLQQRIQEEWDTGGSKDGLLILRRQDKSFLIVRLPVPGFLSRPKSKIRPNLSKTIQAISN